MLLHLVPFVLLEGIPDPEIEAEVHRQLSLCSSVSSLCRLQGEQVSIFFFLASVGKIEKYASHKFWVLFQMLRGTRLARVSALNKTLKCSTPSYSGFSFLHSQYSPFSFTSPCLHPCLSLLSASGFSPHHYHIPGATST